MTADLPTLIASATALVVAFLAPRVAFTRFRRERAWERKLNAYDRVINAIHQLKEVLDYDFDSAVTGRDIPDDVQAAHLEQYQQAKQEVVRTANLGGYVLGAEAQQRLTDYLSQLKKDQTPDWIESLVASAGKTDECLQDLIEIARRDLKQS